MATRADLRSLARIRADQDQSGFPTDAQVDLLLDQSGRDVFHDLMVAGLPLSFSTQTLAITGASAYTITGGVSTHTIRGVYYTQGGSTQELKRLNEGDRAALRGLAGQGQATHYNVLVRGEGGLQVELFPAPTAGGTYTVDYTEAWSGFANDASVWPFGFRSDELVVLRTAAKMLRKEGAVTDAKALEEEYSMLLPKVMVAISHVDQRNPPTIRDVRGTVLRAFDYDVDGEY